MSHDAMNTLNVIPTDRIKSNTEFTRTLLRGLRPPEPSDAARSAYHQSAGELSMQLALYSYALGSPAAEIADVFQQAAVHLARAMALRGVPEPNESRSAWEAELFLSVVGCFGSEADRTNVAKLEPHQYRNDPIRPEHHAVSIYLPVLVKLLGSGTLDARALREAINACEAAKATRDDRQFLVPAARGLLAISERNSTEWHLALAQLLAVHGKEAHSGSLRLLPTGLCSLRALMLAKLGMDAGLTCHASSEYLPLELLGVPEEQP